MRLILMYRGQGTAGIKSRQSHLLRSACSPWPFTGSGWAMLAPDKPSDKSRQKKGNAMQMLIEKMLNDFERGRLTRRQLAATLTGIAAAAAMPTTPALAAPSLKAITLN